MTQQNTTDWDAIEKIALPMANGVTDGRVTGDDYYPHLPPASEICSLVPQCLGWLEAKAPALPFKNVSEALKSIGASISDPQEYDLPDEGMHRLLLQGTRSLPITLLSLFLLMALLV
jgi:hypothetical protein